MADTKVETPPTPEELLQQKGEHIDKLLEFVNMATPENPTPESQSLLAILTKGKAQNLSLQAALDAKALTSPVPPKPKLPSASGGNLNPILNFLQGMTYASDLNSGESAELAKRRSK